MMNPNEFSNRREAKNAGSRSRLAHDVRRSSSSVRMRTILHTSAVVVAGLELLVA